ncbi:MAG: signal peptidase I [Actinomycetota bacterium]
MPRVYEVARELGVSSKEVLAHLEQIGVPVGSHSSSIDDATAARVRTDLSDGAGVLEEAEVAAEPEPETGAPAGVEEDREPRRGEKRERKRRSLVSHLLELPFLILIAFVIAVVVKTFFVQAFYIPSVSMLPTLRVGDRVVVEKVGYFLGEPRRGDVVVFERDVFGEPVDLPWPDDVRNFVRELLGLPTGRAEDYIKRIVAVGGDTIRYVGTPRRLIVNGEVVAQPYINHGRDRFSSTITDRDCERLKMQVVEDACRVPAGRVFVMGDNRANSEDSRAIGPVDEGKIVGRAFAVLWPPSRASGL